MPNSAISIDKDQRACHVGYRSLAECVRDLERERQLVVIDQEVDPYLEVAAIQRRVYQAGGPALLFRRAKGTAFPLLGNLFGTLDRAKFVFRDALESVRRLVELKVDPGSLAKNPWRYRGTPRTLWRLLPRRVRSGPILARRIAIDQLPQIQCWPMDGGPFVTLPQVYTEDPDRPGLRASNLGMYRIQLAGNQYEPNHEIGLHYQIHRGIGVHHAAAIRRGERAAGQRVRRRPARLDGRRGHAPARGAARAGIRRGTGRPARRHGHARRLPPHAGRGRLRHLRLDRSPRPQAGGAVWRPPRLLQPPARFSRAASRTRLPPRRGHLAVYLGGTAAPGRHDVRRLDPRADRSDHSRACFPASTPCMPSTPPAFTPFFWPSPASGMCPTRPCDAPRRS